MRAKNLILTFAAFWLCAWAVVPSALRATEDVDIISTEDLDKWLRDHALLDFSAAEVILAPDAVWVEIWSGEPVTRMKSEEDPPRVFSGERRIIAVDPELWKWNLHEISGDLIGRMGFEQPGFCLPSYSLIFSLKRGGRTETVSLSDLGGCYYSLFSSGNKGQALRPHRTTAQALIRLAKIAEQEAAK